MPGWRWTSTSQQGRRMLGRARPRPRPQASTGTLCRCVCDWYCVCACARALVAGTACLRAARAWVCTSCAHVCAGTHAHACVLTETHVLTHTHKHTHTHAHTHTHTRTHTLCVSHTHTHLLHLTPRLVVPRSTLLQQVVAGLGVRFHREFSGAVAASVVEAKDLRG